MKLKKVLASGLVVAMMAGMLTGCGGGSGDTGNSENTGNSSSNNAASSSNNQDSSSNSESANSGEIVNLKWVTIGNGMPTNYDSWIASVNS